MFKKIALTTLLMASAFGAQAAGSAPFGVTGTITPAACDVTLTGGIVNLGTISTVAVRASSVYFATTYQLASIVVPINITCSAATRVEVAFIDNKSASNFAINANDAQRFGIADGSGTTAIGGYQVGFVNTTIDSVAVAQFLSATTGTTAYFAATIPTVPAMWAAPGRTNAFSKTGGATTPDSLTTLTGNLTFAIFLSKSYVDSATNSITPNGSGTLSLVYL